MKFPSRSRPVATTDPIEATPRPRRRELVIGAGVAAGAAVAAASLHRAVDTPAPALASSKDTPPAEGYRLSEHVRRYYETTRS
jgi:hypothetical protein